MSHSAYTPLARGSHRYLSVPAECLGRVAFVAMALCATVPVAAQDVPGGVSSGLAVWYDAGAGIPQNAANVTANWTQRAGSAGESPLTQQGLTGSIDSIAGAVNFNPALDYNNTGNLGTGRWYGGPGTRDRDWITPNNTGSAFAVGTASDQLSALARTAGITCGSSDTGRCNVGFRQDVNSNIGTNFGGNPSGTVYANGGNPGNRGPTVNVYGLWATAGAGQHRNTRNGWTNTGPGAIKEVASDYRFRVGSFPGFSFDGLVSEVFYYDRKVTEAEAQRITTYLGVKYGVTLDGDATRNNATNYDYLSSSGTVVWAGNGTTAVNAYHRNVFGLGRDSALDQRIATNINDSGPVGTYALDILTMATGTLSAPSQFVATHQGTGTQLAQGQYLMVGNNGASTTAVTAVITSGVSTPHDNGNWSRLNRLWRVQNTGGVGTVSLRFNVPAAGVTALGGNLNDVVLLIDDDGNYTNGGTRVVTAGRSVSGTQVSFNATLANGEIFTLANSSETLTLIKTTVQAAGTYGFTLTGTAQTSGTVTMAANATTTVDGNTGLAGTQSFAIVTAGNPLSITEATLPSGIGLASITCSNTTTGATFSPVYDVVNRTVSIPGASVNAGANITCTFTNAQLLPTFGTCDARMFLDQTPVNTSTLYDVGYASTPFTYSSLGSGTARNGLGYNTVDNYIYGIECVGASGNELIRVGSDGSSQNLGVITGLPASNYNNGVISPAGDYYLMSGFGGTTMYRIDISTRVATSFTISQSIQPADLAWHNGLLWAVSGSRLYSIDPASGVVTGVGFSNPVGSSPAMWGFDNALFAYDTGTTSIYMLDPATGAPTLLSTAPSANNADGANCPGASILFDADLSVTKTNTPVSGPDDLADDAYLPGETRTYSVVVTNNGPFGAQNVAVSDPVPADINAATVSWTCASTSGGAVCGAASGAGALNDTGLDLPPNAVATYQVTLTVPTGFTGDLTNTVTITPPTSINDIDATNNIASDVDGASAADLTITKTNNAGSVAAGGTTVYTIVVTNNGPSAANGAVVNDDWTTVPGLDCSTATGGGTATCAASGTPGTQCPGAATPELLQAGLAIPVFPGGGIVTFTLQCRATASGQ